MFLPFLVNKYIEKRYAGKRRQCLYFNQYRQGKEGYRLKLRSQNQCFCYFDSEEFLLVAFLLLRVAVSQGVPRRSVFILALIGRMKRLASVCEAVIIIVRGQAIRIIQSKYNSFDKKYQKESYQNFYHYSSYLFFLCF